MFTFSNTIHSKPKLCTGDGIDNTCDEDKQIDECAEDIFPPEINAAEAILKCSDKIFPTSQDALDCFSAPGLVSALDDCREVDLTFEDKDAPTCSAIIGIKAVALGCGNRPLEDTTEIDVTVAVDDKKPQVTCNIGAQDLYGSGEFRNLDFSFTAVDEDECTDTDDLAVTIEVLSNEAVAFQNEVSHIGIAESAAHLLLAFTQMFVPLHLCYMMLQNLDGANFRAA